MISVSKPTWWITRGVWPVKTFGFTQIKKGIGSTCQGIMETYTASFNRKYHQLENRAWLRKQRIQFTKGIIYPWKGSQGYSIGRTLSDKIQQRNRWSTRDLMWASVLNQRKKNARRSDYRNNWLTQSSNAKELWFPNQGVRSNALIKDG